MTETCIQNSQAFDTNGRTVKKQCVVLSHVEVRNCIEWIYYVRTQFKPRIIPCLACVHRFCKQYLCTRRHSNICNQAPVNSESEKLSLLLDFTNPDLTLKSSRFGISSKNAGGFLKYSSISCSLLAQKLFSTANNCPYRSVRSTVRTLVRLQ